MKGFDNFNNSKNSSVRDYWAMGIIGDKRQGKTELTKLMITEYLKLYPTRRALVMDVSDAFGTTRKADGTTREGLKEISLKELYYGKLVKGTRKYWTKGARRIVPRGDMDDILYYMVNYYRKGMLVVDEATVVFTDNPIDERAELLIKHTNFELDVICIFHQIYKVPKRFRGHFWHYVFFKTPDGDVSPKTLAASGFPNPTDFYDAWSKAQTYPHYEERILQPFTQYTRNFQSRAADLSMNTQTQKAVTVQVKKTKSSNNSKKT